MPLTCNAFGVTVNTGMSEKQATSFRLTLGALSLLAKIAEREGIDKTDVIEVVIRKEARALGIPMENLEDL